MRIISGSLKGRKINPPKNLPVRPTTDLAKEALFNILSNMLSFEKLKVLDLFAGTGSISFEFASRSCPDITSVELNFKCYKFIQESCIQFGLSSIKAIRADVKQFITKQKNKYDLIFADPPYNLNWTTEIPELVFSRALLEKNGLLILEHPAALDFKEHPNFEDHRIYGQVNFSFFQ